MGDELRKNKSQDPNFKDLIELNDPNEPIKHRGSQIKVFVPTIDEGEGMDEPIIEDIETKFDNIGDNEDKCKYSGFYNFCHPWLKDLAERKEIDNVGGESMIWKFEVLES
ncbi:hypothetical protein Tco_0076338 [Tanacetum coccineum]